MNGLHPFALFSLQHQTTARFVDQHNWILSWRSSSLQKCFHLYLWIFVQHFKLVCSEAIKLVAPWNFSVCKSLKYECCTSISKEAANFLQNQSLSQKRHWDNTISAKTHQRAIPLSSESDTWPLFQKASPLTSTIIVPFWIFEEEKTF